MKIKKKNGLNNCLHYYTYNNGNNLKINDLSHKETILHGLQTVEEVHLNILQLVINSDLLNAEPFNNF